MHADPAYKIYAEQLFSLGHGHALFEPDPAGQGYDQVRVGDVGYIEFGAFHRLFNICLDDEHPINTRVPEDFDPLPEDYRDLSKRHLDAGIWKSSNMRGVGGKFVMSTPLPILSAGGGVKLSCQEARGAALAIKDYADRYDAKSKLAFKLSIRNQHESWHAFATTHLQRAVRPEHIILVTGCDLASEWAITTVCDTDKEAEVSFEVGIPSAASGELALWGNWSGSTSIPQHSGPKRRSAKQTRNIGKKRRPITLPKDQCVFIRTYRVFRRAWFLRTIRAAAKPKNLDREPPHPPSGGGVTTDFLPNDMESIISLDGTSTDQQQDAYDFMARLMFEFSAADMVIIHDDDICDVMSEAGDDSSWDVSRFAKHFYIDLEELDEGISVGQLRRQPNRPSYSFLETNFVRVPELFHSKITAVACSAALPAPTPIVFKRILPPPLIIKESVYRSANADYDENEDKEESKAEDGKEDDEDDGKDKEKEEGSGKEKDHDV